MPLLSAGKSRFLGGGRVPWYRAGGAPVPVAAYQPKSAASLAASYVNLANPGTYDAAPGVAPTLGASGWSFNGTTQYLTSPLFLHGTTHSVIVRVASVTNGGCAFGTFSGLVYQLVPKAAGGIEYRTSAIYTIAPQMTDGVIAMVPGLGGYRNGVYETPVAAAALTSGVTLAIGARNNGGAIQVFLAGTIAAIAIYSSVLTADQVAAVSAAMAAL